MLTNIERKTVFDLRPSRAKADLLPYFRNPVSYTHLDVYKRQTLA